MIAELKTAIDRGPGRSALDPQLTAADRVKVNVERRAQLLRGAPVAIVATLVNGVIATVVGWAEIDRQILLAWAGAIVLLSLARLVLWRRAVRSAESGGGLARFTQLHIIAMALNGMLWGALAPMFALADMLGHAFLPFVIAGMSAAAISSAGASWRAALAFNVPALASLALSYLVFVPDGGLAIAAVVALYGGATTFLATRAQQTIERSIRLRSRNDNLLKALTRQIDAAHESEQRYRALVEASTDLTIIFTPDGVVAYASPASELLLGLTSASLIGRTTRELVHPSDLVLFRETGGKALARIGEAAPLQSVGFRHADGGYRYFEGRLSNMLYVPGVEGFVFTGRVSEDAAIRRLHAAE